MNYCGQHHWLDSIGEGWAWEADADSISILDKGSGEKFSDFNYCIYLNWILSSEVLFYMINFLIRMSVCLIYGPPNLSSSLSRFLGPTLQHLFNSFQASFILFIPSQDFSSHLPGENPPYFNPTVHFIHTCMWDAECWETYVCVLGGRESHDRLIGAILIKLSPDSSRPSFHILFLRLKSSPFSLSISALDLAPYFDRWINFNSMEITIRELSLHLIAKLQILLSSLPPITNENVCPLELKYNLSLLQIPAFPASSEHWIPYPILLASDLWHLNILRTFSYYKTKKQTNKNLSLPQVPLATTLLLSCKHLHIVLIYMLRPLFHLPFTPPGTAASPTLHRKYGLNRIITDWFMVNFIDTSQSSSYFILRHHLTALTTTSLFK